LPSQNRINAVRLALPKAQGNPFDSIRPEHALARNGLGHDGIVTVNVGKRVFVVLPNKDVDLGICNVDGKISIKRTWDGLDWEVDVDKLPQHAPTE